MVIGKSAVEVSSIMIQHHLDEVVKFLLSYLTLFIQ